VKEWFAGHPSCSSSANRSPASKQSHLQLPVKVPLACTAPPVPPSHTHAPLLTMRRRMGEARRIAGQRLRAFPGAAARAAPGGGVGGQPPPAGPPVAVQARWGGGVDLDCGLCSCAVVSMLQMCLWLCMRHCWCGEQNPELACHPAACNVALSSPTAAAGSSTRSSALPCPPRWCRWTSLLVNGWYTFAKALCTASFGTPSALCTV